MPAVRKTVAELKPDDVVLIEGVQWPVVCVYPPRTLVDEIAGSLHLPWTVHLTRGGWAAVRWFDAATSTVEVWVPHQLGGPSWDVV